MGYAVLQVNNVFSHKQAHFVVGHYKLSTSQGGVSQSLYTSTEIRDLVTRLFVQSTLGTKRK